MDENGVFALAIVGALVALLTFVGGLAWMDKNSREFCIEHGMTYINGTCVGIK
jgi:hypothetical protein